MDKQYKCYSNREENKWRIVTLLKPSTVPTFWHVKDVKTNEVFHAAWDMIEEVKQEPNDKLRHGGDNP